MAEKDVLDKAVPWPPSPGRDIFEPQSIGGSTFPHSSNAIYPARSSFTPHLLYTFHSIQCKTSTMPTMPTSAPPPPLPQETTPTRTVGGLERVGWPR